MRRTSFAGLAVAAIAALGCGHDAASVLREAATARDPLGARDPVVPLATLPSALRAAAPDALPWWERLPLERALASSDGRYAPRIEEAGPVLEIPGSVVATFGARGAHLSFDAEHEVSLSVVALGREGVPVALASDARAEVAGAEVRRSLAAGVVDWWRSLPSGLEHGVTISRRPAGDGGLVIEVRVGGALSARAVSDEAVELRDVTGRRVATYAHLIVLDESGTRLPARMSVDGARIVLSIDDDGARYPVVVDPLVTVEEATLLASDGSTADQLGFSVALSSDGARALVGAPFDDTAGGNATGTARIFLWTGATWSEEATLLAPGGAVDDNFGSSVALSSDGDRAIVGAPRDDVGPSPNAGSAHVFVRVGTTWTLEQTLLAPDAAGGDYFGQSVALTSDASRVIVGAYLDDLAGATDGGSARVFLRTGVVWTEEATLVAADAQSFDNLGSSVALSSDGVRALCGAWTDDTAGGLNAGSARVFVRTGASWAEEATLVAPNAASVDYFGWSVALASDASRALIGAYSDDTGRGPNAGTARVFSRTGTAWAYEAALFAADGSPDDQLGYAVALSSDGSRALLGANQDDTLAGGGNVGSARIFVRLGTAWTDEATLYAGDGAAGDLFGVSVALSLDAGRALVGACFDDTTSGTDAGSARVFGVALASVGAACSGDAPCASGFCTDGVCCDARCAGGPSDCLACTAALTGGLDGTCTTLSIAVAPTIVCRAPADACDAAETCTSTSATCPLDALAAAGRPCRAASDACDDVELCTGGSAACPADVFTASGIVCRPSATPCDVADACTGSSVTCPADGVAATGTVCRPATTTGCDVAEVCDGATVNCPGDAFAGAGTVCRSTAGPCDIEERCPGTSAVCPTEVVRDPSIVCRPLASACDLAESCTGVSADCPIDLFAPATTSCGPIATDVCDAPDHCGGMSGACVETFRSGVECRTSAGACDTPEICAGTSAACPPDVVEAAGMVCRASTGGACDPAEACDGTAAACPTDVSTCAPDAGAGSDAAAPLDGGGPSDVGTTLDAGLGSDTGVPRDVGAPAALAGCTCRAGIRAAPSSCLVVAALVIALVRRRRASRWRVMRARVRQWTMLGLALASLLAGAPAAHVLRAPRHVAHAATAALGWPDRIELERALAASDARHQPRIAGGAPMLGERGTFDGRGAHISFAGGHVLDLGVAAIGRPSAMRELGAAPDARIVGAEVRLERAPGIVEWWRSLPSGLEQGVTIDHRPTGDGPLHVEMTTGSVLRPELRTSDEIVLRDARGNEIARYAHVVVRDAGGRRMPARLALSGERIRICVDDASARYPLVVDPLVFATEDATLVAPDGAADDDFGWAVALSADGTRALVGAYLDRTAAGFGAGSARVFVRSGATWTEEAMLVASDGATGDRFGAAVALAADGSRALVGAYLDDTTRGADAGSARVFVRTGSSWAEEATLELALGAGSDQLGMSVALTSDGSRALVGASGRDGPMNSGSAHVFARTGTAWAAEAALLASGAVANDLFGTSVALTADGSRAIVGGDYADTVLGVDGGSARVYARTGSTWSEEAALLPMGGAPNDHFGVSVALSSDASRAIVGARFDDVAAVNSGGARVFVRAGSIWSEEARLAAADGTSNDELGWSVALSSDGSRALAGAPLDDTARGTNAGSARVFVRSTSTWTEEAMLLASDGAADDRLGRVLGLSADGMLAILGAHLDDTSGGANAGSARLFSILAGGPLGAPCVTGSECLGALCVDGVCCESACGAGAMTDCMACTAALTGSADGTCRQVLASAGAICRDRAPGDACDVPETCDGAGTLCPADRVETAAVVCRAALGPCDAAERCTGASALCPPDAAASAGTSCRAPAGPCDTPEVCDGSSFTCPGDVVAAGGVVCRSRATECDVDERCTGAEPGCPVDALAPAGTVCRVPAAACDATDVCDGSSAVCPETFQPAGVVCNALVSDVCDAPDVCTGMAADCPSDYRTGVECRAALGTCDVPESCAGASPACPPDVLLAAGVGCRASSDPACDPVETCDGVSTTCPADVTTCEPSDAGPRTDAGTPSDAGSIPDGGAEPGGPAATTGCGCRARDGERGSLAALLAGVALFAARALRRREKLGR